MVVIISQGSMNLCQTQIMLNSNFIDAQTHTLVPNRNVLNGNAPTRDTRLSLANLGCHLDVSIKR